MATKIELGRPPYIDPDSRDWRKLVGEPGDLTDILLATICQASMAGSSKISNHDLYESFAQLEKEFPDLIPDLLFECKTLKWDGKPYPHLTSHRLAKAIDPALLLGLEFSPYGNHFEIREDKAQLILGRLRKRVGEEFVRDLEPVGKRLGELMKEKQAGLPNR